MSIAIVIAIYLNLWLASWCCCNLEKRKVDVNVAQSWKFSKNSFSYNFHFNCWINFQIEYLFIFWWNQSWEFSKISCRRWASNSDKGRSQKGYFFLFLLGDHYDRIICLWKYHKKNYLHLEFHISDATGAGTGLRTKSSEVLCWAREHNYQFARDRAQGSIFNIGGIFVIFQLILISILQCPWSVGEVSNSNDIVCKTAKLSPTNLFFCKSCKREHFKDLWALSTWTRRASTYIHP